MKVFEACGNKTIPIGYQAEDDVTAIRFKELGAWKSEFGDGTIVLTHKPSGEEVGYPVELTVEDGGESALWIIQPYDVSKAGNGYCQLTYEVGGTVVKKSQLYRTYVAESINGGGDVPSGYEEWYNKVITAKSADIGDLNDLHTRNHEDLVSSINELADISYTPIIKKISDYAYEAWFTNIDYDNAYAYYKEGGDIPDIGACSAVRNGNFYGRNLDWKYNRSAEFLVHVPKIAGRHASIGVAGGLADLTEEFVSNGEYSPLYKIVPFNLYDGINDAGVVANMNVVPNEKNGRYITPVLDQEIEIPATMLVRYILDNFGSAYDAVSYIYEHAAIYFSKATHDMDYELHFMVADADSTYVVEFVDGHTVVLEGEVMTNFNLDGTQVNPGGTVYTPATMDADHDAARTNMITPHGSGLERWNLIVEGYDSTSTEDGMRDMLNSLTYTRTYSTSDNPSDPFWYTEYVGGDFTVDTPASEFANIVAEYGETFTTRSRDDVDPFTWQTVHSVIYDISEKTAKIIFQESGVEYTFKLGGDEGVTDHRKLTHRDDLDQHPISAITGLQDELDSKQSTITDEDVLAAFMETGTLDPVANDDNKLFIDDDGKIYIL